MNSQNPPQALLRLRVERRPGQSQSAHLSASRLFQDTLQGRIPPAHEGPARAQVREARQLADVLKAKAARLCEAVRSAEPAALPATLDHLRDVEWMLSHALRSGQVPPAEGELSGRQLQHPVTLMDWLGALDLTRRNHRPPPFVQPHGGLAEQVLRRLDVLAALVVGKSGAAAAWAELQDESEVGA